MDRYLYNALSSFTMFERRFINMPDYLMEEIYMSDYEMEKMKLKCHHYLNIWYESLLGVDDAYPPLYVYKY